MKSADEILNTLGGLSPQDREWILRQLSPRARKKILDGNLDSAGAKDEARRGVKSQVPVSKPVAAPVLRSPAEAARLLKEEPAWLAHCVLAEDFPNRDEVRAHLSAPLRAGIERLDASGVRYPSRIRMRACSAFAAALEQAPPESAPKSGLLAKSGAALGRMLARLRQVSA